MVLDLLLLFYLCACFPLDVAFVLQVESFLDLYELGSEGEVKREGKLTQQGNRYVIQDGDICFFRFKLPNYKVWRG